MALDPGNAALGLSTGVGISNTFMAFTTFTPSYTDVREGSVDDGKLVANLRTGEVSAIVVGAGVALAASAVTRSALPFVTSIAVLALLIAVYEITLRS